MVNRCVCQICVCGRHRCPHRPFTGKQSGPCTFSEYNDEYKKKHVPRAQNFKPVTKAVQSEGPLSDKTTQRMDYIRHPTEKPQLHKAEEWSPPGGDIDTMTSYAKEYTPKEAPPPKPIRRDDKKRVQGKFEGDPTYRSDYRKWQLPERKPFRDISSYQAPEAPFEGDPTYKRDYVRHPHAMRQSLKPQEMGGGSGEPFDDRTGYRDDYIRHAVEPRRAREKQEYKGPGAPLDDLTTHKVDFGRKEAQKAASFKPVSMAFRSSEPLSDNTTFRNDYKQWALNRPQAYKPDEWTKPAGEMDLQTTTQIQYDRKPIAPTKLLRPIEKRPSTATFDGSTTNKEDYRKWPIGARVRPTARADYQAPEAPFEGQSTVQAHYTPKPLNLARSFKPNSGEINSGPFDGNTMYRLDYVPKEVEPCPAALLDSSKSQYTYADQNDVGHKFYRSMYESVTSLPGGNSAPSVRMSNVAFA